MRLAEAPARPWFDPEPIIEQHGALLVVRDDQLEGGSKTRFLPHLISGAREVVFGGPFCGGAPLALSVIGKRLGVKATLFYADRRELHPYQRQARRNGATLVFVRPGYMTVVQRRARDYCERTGALFLPLGFDVPAAADPFIETMCAVRAAIGDPPEVWCATGSGMLARCLGVAFPRSRVVGVTVGLESRHAAQRFPGNVELRPAGLRFEQASRAPVPIRSHAHYDRKALALAVAHAQPGALFWNVAG